MSNSKNKSATSLVLFALIFAVTVLLAGCDTDKNNANETIGGDKTGADYITVTGTAGETKDGYYVSGYVLEYNEIEKYNADYAPGEYGGKNLEVTGKEMAVDEKCTPDIQCREGTYKIIYDIQSIKIKN